jgi:murein DD-endopeptidase MepM/ murein hydrolase activator NlpD
MFIVFILSFVIYGCTYFGPGIFHTVSEGETVWEISRAYKVDAQKLVEANKRVDADRIMPGQRIYVPGARYPKAVPKSSLDFVWPVRGKVIRRFGKHDNKRYLGIGVKAEQGAPVAASESGKVIFASENFRSYGKTIIIEHNENYVTVYSHNRQNFVRKGQKVEKGQKIASVGSTGRADEPHLYFEIRYREKPRNPLFILP